MIQHALNLRHVALEYRLISTQLHNSFILKITLKHPYVLALAGCWSYIVKPSVWNLSGMRQITGSE